MGKSANPDQPSLSDLRPIIPLSRIRSKRNQVSPSAAFKGKDDLKEKVLRSFDYDIPVNSGRLSLAQKIYLANESDQGCFSSHFDKNKYLSNYGLNRDLVTFLDYVDMDQDIGDGQAKQFLVAVQPGVEIPPVHEPLFECRLQAMKEDASFISGRGSDQYSEIANRAADLYENRHQKALSDWTKLSSDLLDLKNKTSVLARKEFAHRSMTVIRKIIFFSDNPQGWSIKHEQAIVVPYKSIHPGYGRKTEMNWLLNSIVSPT